jgi:hypothetical protein
MDDMSLKTSRMLGEGERERSATEDGALGGRGIFEAARTSAATSAGISVGIVREVRRIPILKCKEIR